MPDPHGPAPLLSPLGMAIALAAALVLSWPMMVTGDYLIFSDTGSYIRGGEIIWRIVTDMLGFGSDPTAAGGGGAALDPGAGGGMRNVRGEPYVVRSFVYSLYTLVTGAALWPAGFAILQAAMTLWMLFALIGPGAAARPWVLAGGFAYLAAFTTLPWFTVYLMPDLLAAAVLIYAAVLMRRFDDLATWQRVAIGLIASFAIAAHYGHGPLAAGILGAVLIWRLIAGRLTVAVCVAAVLPVLFSPLANLSASSVALETPSVAPLRLPILLARSIQDGPARWYLEDACPEAPLAFCEAFGSDVPRNIPHSCGTRGGSICCRRSCWRGSGRKSSAFSPWRSGNTRRPDDVVAGQCGMAGGAHRDGRRFLWQTARPTANGTGRVGPEPGDPGGLRSRRSDRDMGGDGCPSRFAPGGAAVAGRGGDRRGAVLGLLLNALIFGGLSAPVDRYQSRIAWLLPAAAAIVAARMCADRAGRAGRAGVSAAE